MKYVVNDGCIGCRLCEGTCPEVFFMTEEGVAKAVEKEVPAEYEDAAMEAENGCPVGAVGKV